MKGDVLRGPPFVVPVFFDRLLGQDLSRLPGGRAGDAPRVEGIEITAGGKNVVSPSRDQTRRTRLDESSVKSVQEGARFVGRQGVL